MPINSTYKNLPDEDRVTTRTLLHEAIPLTGTIVSGTYTDANIKNYAHGMFQTVYDYPYLSSSANHIFDITVGVHDRLFPTAPTSSFIQQSKKRNIYNQMAQVLMGYDVTGSILRFDEDGDVSGGGTKQDAVMFFNFARLLTKDEIKKGSFMMEFGVAPAFSQNGSVFSNTSQRLLITDFSGSNGFLTNSPAGEYGVLYATASLATSQLLPANRRYPVGLLFYQAGVAVISGSIFNDVDQGGILNNSVGHTLFKGDSSTFESFTNVLTGSEISGACDQIRNRLFNVSFNNTIELNSQIYFCRVKNNEFNYSSNPTYLSESKIVVKDNKQDMPVSYITTVGLYNSTNELLAVAKLSEPLKKTPDTEFTIRVRLDY